MSKRNCTHYQDLLLLYGWYLYHIVLNPANKQTVPTLGYSSAGRNYIIILKMLGRPKSRSNLRLHYDSSNNWGSIWFCFLTVLFFVVVVNSSETVSFLFPRLKFVERHGIIWVVGNSDDNSSQIRIIDHV